MMHMNALLLQAVDRLILRGRPTGYKAQLIIKGGGILDAWPPNLRLGSHVFHLISIQNRNGDQEAIYKWSLREA